MNQVIVGQTIAYWAIKGTTSINKIALEKNNSLISE